MSRFLVIVVLFVFGFIKLSVGQRSSLRDNIVAVAQSAKGTVGVSYLNFQDNDTLTVNGQSHFPMQSIMKFPLAMAVLHAIDAKKLALNQKVHLSKEDLSIPVSSPIRNKYPDGNIDLTLDELLSYTVSQSDNNGCDKLYQLAGGPKAVNAYIHSLGVKDISIVSTEREMGKDWETQYQNWCTPNAIARLLYLFDKGGVLSAASRDYLMKIMTETVNAPKRLKGLLPEGTIVAHKPGTSGTNGEGLNAATNDVGIIELPGKQHIAVAVFITNSTADIKTREAAIAKIAKLVWDHRQ